ncbi:hypothetical protein HK102_011689, partial [Quaeritorhiza haematococci]
KAEEILGFFEEEDVGIAFLAETWLLSGAEPPIRRPFLDIRNSKEGAIEGGRRGQGGLLGFAREDLMNEVRVVEKGASPPWALVEVGSQLFAAGYFPPSAEFGDLEFFFERVGEATNGWQKDVMITGDFNARMGAATGDGSVNARGQALLALLQELPLELVTPEE